MQTILIVNANVVNEGEIIQKDIYIKDGLIEKIANSIDTKSDILIDAKGKYLLPGAIDDQVHFREPGLTHKGTIYTEAKAAVAGGITSFMEMPNTIPPAITQERLEMKYVIASQNSLANYSFFMGASNDNMEEVMKTNIRDVCGIKVFMGSSTGNMLVDNADALDKLFRNSPMLIATHCEDEQTIRENGARFLEKYGEDIPAEFHGEIRSREACLKSSSFAVELARKHNTRLHILHISTEDELALFTNSIPLKKKRITAEVCIHHLSFDSRDYKRLGNFIKWNPAIKESHDREALWNALLDDRLDIIATDHAPHTLEEKSNKYIKAPSGGPLVQHSLNAMIQFHKEGKISLERIAEKMCHAPATCFQIEKRGFIREGYFADLVLVDMKSSWTVSKDNILSKCGWSPFEGKTFDNVVTHTIVSGHLAYEHGKFNEAVKGRRLSFERG